MSLQAYAPLNDIKFIPNQKDYQLTPNAPNASCLARFINKKTFQPIMNMEEKIKNEVSLPSSRES